MPHHGDFPVVGADGRLLPGKADLDLRDHIRRGRAVQPRHTAARNDRHKQHDQQQPFADALGDAVQNLHGGRTGFVLRLIGGFLRQQLRRGGHRGSLRLFVLFRFLQDLLDGDLQRAGHIGGAFFLQRRFIGRGLRCGSGGFGGCIDLGGGSRIGRCLGSVCGLCFGCRGSFLRRSGGFLCRCPGSLFCRCPGGLFCRCSGGFGFARTGRLFLGCRGFFGCCIRRRFGRRCRGLRRNFRRLVRRGCRLCSRLPGQFFLVIHIQSSPKSPAGNYSYSRNCRPPRPVIAASGSTVLLPMRSS